MSVPNQPFTTRTAHTNSAALLVKVFHLLLLVTVTVLYVAREVELPVTSPRPEGLGVGA